MSVRAVATLVVLGAVLALVIGLRLIVGGDRLGLPESEQIFDIRMQRVFIGLIVGSSLAMGGVLLQSMLRNPLASPDLLGLASGSGLAVMIAAYVGGGVATMGPGFGPAALVGAIAALGVVYMLSQRSGLIDPVSMILIGVVVSVICGAATALVQHMMPDQGYAAARWTLGAIDDNARSSTVWVVGVITLLVGALGVWCGRGMDVAALGEDEARASGVRLGRLRMIQFVSSGVLTAGAVVLAGPIGFVGLVCPHVVRLGAGPAHRVVLIGSALAGGAMIVGADALVMSISLGAGRLPIGVLTALVGGPVLLVMLRRQRMV